MRISSVIRIRINRIFIGIASLLLLIFLLVQLNPSNRLSAYADKGRAKGQKLPYSQTDGVAKPTNKTVVILYTNQRSGSTFLGEIFNHNPDAFYIFEPLLPFTTSCRKLARERVQLLTEISQCEFENIRQSYRKAFDVTRYPDTVTKCLNNTICFLSNQQGRLLEAYAKACSGERKFNPNSSDCGLPLRSEYINKVCRESDFTVFKVLRICSLESLETFHSDLRSKGYRVFFIHLVRDPRAVLSSMLDIHLDGITKKNIGDRAESLCNRYSENLRYVDRAMPGENSLVSVKHYIRIRFEDAAFDSVNVARSLYRFIGKPMPTEVMAWINKSQTNMADVSKSAREKAFELVRLYSVGGMQQGGPEFGDITKILHGNKDPYSTIRDPTEVLGKWRKSLSFEQVQAIQSKCEDAMAKLHYRPLTSPEEMLNLTLKYH